MAGNLVKWWKHKILGGYKQFSVQECTTDSEELMYHQVRASSSCSAPPDLLLVSDRENNIPLRSPVVNIIAAAAAAASTTAPTTTTTSPSSGINACHLTSASNNNQQRHNQQKLQYHHHHQQQQQQQHQHHQVTTQQLSLAYNNGTKDVIGNSVSGSGAGKHQKQTANINNGSKQQQQQQHGGQLQQTQDMQHQPTSLSHDIVDGLQMETQQTTNNHSSTKQHVHHNHQTQQQQAHQHHNPHHQQRSEEHIRLEEFTCDVSVEGGKSSQPLQFSFTFYDLDGHHGKITKDDIVGIVYTIYESIGKSVVVPHSGSKTINVRLTVSPEGKSKSTKNKKALDHHHHTTLLNSSHQKASALATSNTQAASRRLHRYRPRKLIKSDDEDDDSNSDKDRLENLAHVLAHKANTKTQKLNKLKAEQNCCRQQQQQQQHTSMSQHSVPTDLPNSPLDTIYDNLKASSPPETCQECLAAVDETRNTSISPLVSAATTTTTTPATFPVANKTTSTTNEAYMKHVASTRIKMLRKSRKQKHQDCLETRQRSLSVGNETCWKNRHLQPTKHPNQQQQQQLLWQAEQQLNHSVGVGGDIVDGVQLRNPLKNGKSMMAAAAAQKRNSAECWKTALNRNDLISIIRESMEKNRLCFQLNGKPQANVSPIRQPPPPPPNSSNSCHQQQQQPLTHNQHAQHQQASSITSSQQRQRSNTVSKIPTLIANHTNNVAHHSVSPQHHHQQQRSSSCANTISNCNNNNNNSSQQQHDLVGLQHEHHNNTNSSNNSNNIYHHHLQPHIPIYHQQMAINPAVIAAQNALLTAAAANNTNIGHHGKMNLCGYDSFLHATICGGGLSHSPPPPPPAQPQASTNHTSLNTQITTSPSASNISGHHQHHQQHQQIATVQPIMSSNSKHLAAVTPNQIKTSKILRTTTTTANTTQNSPQYHGYQRLPSSSKHNLSALHLLSPNTEKPSLSELDKWRRDQVKNYDQLLYAKLSEKLQQTNLVTTNQHQHLRENNQRRKQRLMRQRRANALQQQQQQQQQNQQQQEVNNATVLINTTPQCLREDTDYNSMIPIVGDPVECENLLGQTSDEETHSQHETINNTNNSTKENVVRHVAEGTLVDLEDNNVVAIPNQSAKLSNLNVDTLLSVENDDAAHNLHSLVDDLEIDEDLEDDDLDEELEELANVQETGRNTADSQNSSNANNAATLVNTSANNTGANNASSVSSSLIHRYVHEHIHHHYHHFEEKEE